MAQPARIRKISREEYLELERNSAVRHEYIAGLVFAMASESRTNNEIAQNILDEVRRWIRGGPCRSYVGNVRLRIDELDIYYYPDLIVTCDPADNDRHHVTRPTLLVEILSPSAKAVDLREKRFNYVKVESLQEYLIVSSDMRRVEILRRENDWEPEIIEGDDLVQLRSIGFELPLAAIYEGVTLDLTPER